MPKPTNFECLEAEAGLVFSRKALLPEAEAEAGFQPKRAVKMPMEHTSQMPIADFHW